MGWVELIGSRRIDKRARCLNQAVRALPVETRRAMLAAAEGGGLIIGAYSDRKGQVCPMLAAHRLGARTHVGEFPRAWDAFGNAKRPRPATARELEILRALLEESLSGGETSQPSSQTEPQRGLAVV
jgi:hypothetical protein